MGRKPKPAQVRAAKADAQPDAPADPKVLIPVIGLALTFLSMTYTGLKDDLPFEARRNWFVCATAVAAATTFFVFWHYAAIGRRARWLRLVVTTGSVALVAWGGIKLYQSIEPKPAAVAAVVTDSRTPKGFSGLEVERGWSTFRLNLGGSTFHVRREALEAATAAEPRVVMSGDASQVPFVHVPSLLARVGLYLRDGRVQLAYQVEDEGGRTIVNVADKLSVNEPSYDLNKNEQAIEIVTEAGQPIFQLIERNPGNLVVYGLLPKRSGRAIYLDQQGLHEVDASNLPPDVIPLKRLFKYPASLHPGEME